MILNRISTAFGAFLLVLAASPAGAQVALPDMGASAGQTLPPHKARELGAQAYRAIRQQAHVLDDPLLTEYIESVGFRLAARSLEPDRNYTFFVVAAPSVNAFAIPGGYIGIHSGLITTAEQESEMAAVLAHEIAHVTQDHIARVIDDMQRVSLPVMLGMLGVILASGGNPEVAQAAVIGSQAALIQRQINFTRHHEAEADRIGINTLAQAGYDPESMAVFFHRLDRSNLAYGKGPSELLRTHPVTSKRIAEAKDRAREVRLAPRREDPQLFLLMREHARVLAASEDRGQSPLEYYKAMMPMVEDQSARRAMEYGRALALLELERPDEAANLITDLIEQDGPRLPYRLALARAHMESGDTDRALALYEELQDFYGRRYPVTFAHANALMDADRPAEAERLLRPLVNERPKDVELQRRYAHVADAAGARTEARIAIAETYYLEGRLYDALQQLRQGQSNMELKLHERQRLEARFDEMWKRLSEDQRDKLERDFPSKS